MQDTLNSKKKGDMGFRQKEFKDAIECYTLVFPLLIGVIYSMLIVLIPVELQGLLSSE